jgi:hypothetical protein
MFSALNENDKNIVIGAIEEQIVQKGDKVIQ